MTSKEKIEEIIERSKDFTSVGWRQGEFGQGVVLYVAPNSRIIGAVALGDIVRRTFKGIPEVTSIYSSSADDAGIVTMLCNEKTGSFPSEKQTPVTVHFYQSREVAELDYKVAK